MNRLTATLVTFLIVGVAPLAAQEILLDETERAAELLLFRSYDDPLVYYYLPERPNLAYRDDGTPEFSLMKYTRPRATEGGSHGIREAAGGGVLHFLATYGVSESTVREAERELQQTHEGARIAGPVMFRSGSFALVTTIADEKGRFANRVVGVGNAPLIEGAKVAISVDLNAEGASLLWESFKLTNPDISLVFEMEFAGYRSPYEAKMEVDWDKVYRDDKINVGGKVYWFGAEVDLELERLRQEGAIRLHTKGEHAPMDAIIKRAHAMLMEMMFQAEPPPKEEGGLLGGVGRLIEKIGVEIRKFSPYSFNAKYRMRDIRRSGKATFDFNHHDLERLHTVMSGNIGNLHRRWGNDPRVFRAASLDDPVFKQREVFVTVDGRSQAEFADYVNFVTIQLRKRHESGEWTMQEVVVDEDRVSADNNRFRMVYGWKGDNDRARWLNYEYRTVWNFRRGVQADQGWQEADTFVINLAPPFEHRHVSLEADPETFRNLGVRHAVVQLHYDFFGKTMSHQEVVRVAEGRAVSIVDYVCEWGKYDYEYSITWYLRDGKRIRQALRADSSDVLYVDELPSKGVAAAEG